MRYAFIRELSKQAEQNKDIMLLTADLGFTVFEEFRAKFPKQFINVGVAESNMIGIAAGLALSGKIVFAYSIATFATLRTFEQIRNDVCLHNLPVTIIGSGAGLSYSDAGPSHHALEDIAVMRTLPNMTILCPADPTEMEWATKQVILRKSPSYLRIGKHGEPVLYTKNPKLKIGKGSILRKGKDVAIIATGNIVSHVNEAVSLLEKKGIFGTLVSMHTVKPLDKKLILQLATEYKTIITVEEHMLPGGLGSSIAEIITEQSDNKAKLHRIGMPNEFSKTAGSQAFMREIYGLSPRKIASNILKYLRHD